MNPLKRLYNFQINNRLFNLWLLASYTVLITALSLKPHIDMGEIPYNDKLAHYLTYVIFTLLAWRITQSTRPFLRLSVGIFIYSGLIEIAQSYTGRIMSAMDLLANGAGITSMVFIFLRGSFSTKP